MTNEYTSRQNLSELSFGAEMDIEVGEIDINFGQINEAIEIAAQRQARNLERELALAFHRGYDGADEIYGSRDRSDGDGYTLRAGIQPWMGDDQPEMPTWAAYHRRYDFRGITYQDLRELHEGNGGE